MKKILLTLVSVLWGALTALMGFPVIEEGKINIKNFIILIIGIIIINIIWFIKEK